MYQQFSQFLKSINVSGDPAAIVTGLAMMIEDMKTLTETVVDRGNDLCMNIFVTLGNMPGFMSYMFEMIEPEDSRGNQEEEQ